MFLCSNFHSIYYCIALQEVIVQYRYFIAGNRKCVSWGADVDVAFETRYISKWFSCPYFQNMYYMCLLTLIRMHIYNSLLYFFAAVYAISSIYGTTFYKLL